MLAALAAILTPSTAALGQDYVAQFTKAVERSTLDQPGTHPFHLRAEFAPSLERDKALGRTGTVEIWWTSPTKCRREIHSTEFSQVEIVDGIHIWQKNSSDYFPEWLREVVVALVKPVPNFDQALVHVKTAEVRNIMGATHISWGEIGTDGTVSKAIGQGIDLNNGGPLFAMSIGSSADLKDPSDFHGRQVARTVSSGDVTARISLLEDLKSTPADFFDASAPASDPLLRTVVLKELDERVNVIEDPRTPWPPLAIGPLQGVMLFEVVIDRAGKVQEIESYLSDNPGLRDVAESRVRAMRFHPHLVDGVPAQVVTTITLPFKTTRPPGVETFAPSKDILDKGRKLSFPAAGGVSPYVLQAEFTTRNGAGEITKGTYTDTWLSDTQWRREAVFGKSRLIRSRSGDKRYLIAEGADAGILRILFESMEPIPDTTSWYDIEWLVKHDTVDGFAALRVSRGHESPEGVLEPQAQAYWFDEEGQLIKAHTKGLDTRLSRPSDFAGMQVARRVELLNQGKLALRLDVTELSPVGTLDPSMFTLKGHESVRQFTAEVR
jgi:hypothetical protein